MNERQREQLSNALESMNERNAYNLAAMAECGSPDSPDSAGAVFLTSVRDRVVELIEECDDWHDIATSDRLEDLDYSGGVHSIADEAPDVYTYTRWSEFVDLQAYQEDVNELGEVDGDDLTRSVAGVALYMIAERLAWELIREVAESYRDAVADLDDDEEVDR